MQYLHINSTLKIHLKCMNTKTKLHSAHSTQTKPPAATVKLNKSQTIVTLEKLIE